MNILMIEDDKIINEGVCTFLQANSYQVFSAFSGEDGLQIFEKEAIHLVLLDIMLPGINGIEVLQQIKQKSDVPVIMLTALEDEETQVKSFDGLCDDYIAKPFSLVLLKKRIEAVLRHSNLPDKTWTYQQLQVNFETYEAEIHGQSVALTPKEFEILKFLVENEGRVLSRNQILDKIWNNLDDEPFERVIDVYIKNLRKKLNLDCIQTVKGIGYKLTIED